MEGKRCEKPGSKASTLCTWPPVCTLAVGVQLWPLASLWTHSLEKWVSNSWSKGPHPWRGHSYRCPLRREEANLWPMGALMSGGGVVIPGGGVSLLTCGVGVSVLVGVLGWCSSSISGDSSHSSCYSASSLWSQDLMGWSSSSPGGAC